MSDLQIQVWSDVACPWCYVGKRRLEAALAQVHDGASVSVTYRAFELDPTAPATYPPSPSYVERLARKYSVPTERAAQMIERMSEVGRREGIAFDFDRIRGGNTFDAHRLLWWAGVSGSAQSRLKERLLSGYFCEGVPIGDAGALLSLAEQVGLDVDAASAALASGEGADAVRAEQQRAAELGISGVPFFAIGRYGVSGAQPPEVLLGVLQRALGEAAPRGVEAAPEGAACTPDGCA